METTTPIMSQHAEYVEWLKKLSFYKDDLAVWQRRLEEISVRNTSREVMSRIEKFQNQVKIQHEQIDLLKHEINVEERSIEQSIAKNPVASDHRKMKDNEILRNKVVRFEELFADFRKNIMDFLAIWM